MRRRKPQPKPTGQEYEAGMALWRESLEPPVSKVTLEPRVQRGIPDPLWDTMAALFYGGKVPSHPRNLRTYINGIYHGLVDVGATPEELKRRYHRWPKLYPSVPVTPMAVLKNWHTLAPPPEETTCGRTPHAWDTHSPIDGQVRTCLRCGKKEIY